MAHEEPHDNTSQSADESKDGSVNGETTFDLRAVAQEALELSAQDEGQDSPKKPPIGMTTTDIESVVDAAHGADALASEQTEADIIFEQDTLLRMEIAESTRPIHIQIKDEIIVGRADKVTKYLPEVDLSSHGAYRLGLSRRHAIMRRDENRLLIIDLGSRNGTFVNGVQLQANEPHYLSNGDEIRFGNLKTQIIFERQEDT